MMVVPFVNSFASSCLRLEKILAFFVVQKVGGLQHNILALQRNENFFVGKCIALSISYGGPGPHFLCETIARYLCNEPVTSPELDVPDYEVRERIEKVRVYHVYVLIYSLKQ